MKEHLLPFEKTKRKILVKKEAKTDKGLGCKPEERKTEEIISYGIVNINKPQGPTSHQISAYVQKILGITKSGHSGTLE
jgi:H/ACA ribonucleoprotein complex subunit 4